MEQGVLSPSGGGNFFKAYSLEIAILISTILLASTIFVSVSNLARSNDALVARLGSSVVGQPTGNTANAAGGNNAGANNQAAIDVTALVGDSPAIGNEDAKVTIVVFSDPSCPFCGAAAGGNQEAIDYLKSRDPNWVAPVPGIINDYAKTGKVNFVFKYFPGHGKGVEAMKMMWCAGDQQKFWEVHDVMFQNQDLMEAGNTTALKSLALGTGLDATTFDTCLSSGKYDARIGQETQQGRAAQLSGTPAFFVNNQVIEGAVSYPDIRQVIEQELAE